ncbi:methyltransferase type 12 domain-containing protein [Heterostelium album PN500]|uniref:Methyltransferase type 12 domain-containing protein n=1 Tax=Heterostelium pallidum (strain ATCC 26659 / Pp 5 / PN500) TaxID=670386 RepID=D3B9X7_HETP5|nr:methyltransferase type 12 domain-containing protein [Heterostelium album PN500]EFA81364.1 methyltransferase type 12 domain-containing protein [Heterostelium album PN500]|eukprot:XP_020433482.1 methyltransferase type 12 domain-containing protein [Heterostelium album PN500]
MSQKRLQEISNQISKIAISNNHSIITKEVLRSNDKDAIHKALDKLNNWINNPNSDIKQLEQTGIFIAMLELLNNEDIEIVRHIVLIFKLLTLKDTILNEILRSLDAVHKLELLLESSYDPMVLEDTATAIECLRRCTPYSIRRVGLGQYNENNGQFQWTLDLQQLHYKDVGVAWRVWDAGIGFTRWILENPQIFEGKEVLELGAGLGIAGLAAGLLCQSVLMTDYTPKIVSTLRENVKMNSVRSKLIRDACKVAPLDWTKDKVPKPFHYQVIIGTEVVYDVNLVEHLANVIHQSLTPDGVFYGTAATIRRGIPEFIKCMEDKFEFEVKVTDFPKRFVPDTNFDTYFFECRKRKNQIPLASSSSSSDDSNQYLDQSSAQQ